MVVTIRLKYKKGYSMDAEKLKVKIVLTSKLNPRSSNIQGYFIVDDIIVDKYTFNESGKWESETEIVFEPGEHKIGFTLNNKSSIDTTVDDAGNIVNDTLITLDCVEIDDIEITELFLNLAKFVDGHNIERPIMRNIGVNGAYYIEFTTPFYEWLLSKV